MNKENGQVYILGLLAESISKMKENFYNKALNELEIDIEKDINNYCKDLIDIYNKEFSNNRKTRRIFSALLILYENTKTELFNYILSCGVTYEKELYKIFDKNIYKLFDNKVQVIKYKNSNKYKPDRWIKYDDCIIPVEFKRYSFTDDSKKQLKKYIDYYGSKFGIAIGAELKTILDNNMMFISIYDLNAGKSFYREITQLRGKNNENEVSI